MKYRIGMTALAVLLMCSVFVCLARFPSQQVSAQKVDNSVKIPKSTPQLSARVKNVIKGSEHPEQIPDHVAYELFFRTIAEGNARGLVKLAGLDEQQVETVMATAYSLNDDLNGLDLQAKKIKADPKSILPISAIQSKRDELVDLYSLDFMSGRLGKEGYHKLDSFVRLEVKGKTQKALLKTTSKIERRTRSKFQNAFAPATPTGGGELYYYYCDGWADDFGVYGSGSISEQYTSDTSYRVTVTVTSPSSRSNSTSSDWSLAPVINNAGLSIGVEDGNYSVDASFEEQDGYYDEYGNFYGNGSSYVGSGNDNVIVAPTIALISGIVTPQQFYLTGNPPGGNGSGGVSLRLTATESVPTGTTIELDFYETGNDGGVGYTVVPGTNSGYPPYPAGSRQIRRIISNAGTIEQLSGLFTINLTPSSSNTGTVVNQIRIDKIIANEGGTNGGVQGENSQTPVVFTLLLAATPTPLQRQLLSRRPQPPRRRLADAEEPHFPVVIAQQDLWSTTTSAIGVWIFNLDALNQVDTTPTPVVVRTVQARRRLL